MDTLRQITGQKTLEHKYARKLVYKRVKEHALLELSPYIDKGVKILEEFINKTHAYESKQKRLNQVKELNLYELVSDILVEAVYCFEPMLFTAFTSMLSKRLHFDDRPDAIKTIAELTVQLCELDTFDIFKQERLAGRFSVSSLYLKSNIALPNWLMKEIHESRYVAPMICEPVKLECNTDTGYLLIKESLILGRGNHHLGDICLDVLNTINSVPLALSKEFLSQVEEEPEKEFTIEWAKRKALEKGEVIDSGIAHTRAQQAISNWHEFKQQSYDFYSFIAKEDKFYLTNKVDKRGRIYPQGYHINTQGTAFKKAAIEFANTELVIGVPNE